MAKTYKKIFGLHNKFCRYKYKKSYKNLSQLVRKYGFDDYSPYGITSFLSFRYPVLQHTMFKDFTRCIDYDDFIRYLQFSTRKDISIEKAAAIAEYLLLESIKRKVGNAKKIGILLSGGLDSSLIVAMCKKLFPDRCIHTYSMGFYGDDEFMYSREIAETFSTKHFEKILYSVDFFGENSLVKPLIKQKAAPLHPNELPLAHAEIQARQDCCDVVLCGEGADDVFGGYSHNLLMYASFDGKPQDFYQYIMKHYRYISMENAKTIIKDKYLIDDTEMIEPIFVDFSSKDIRDVMLYFIQSLHTKGLIERGMNALRFCGFGNGFVFLDSALITFVNSLPFEYKIANKKPVPSHTKHYKEFSDTYCVSKFLLKNIAESYLPESIIYRVKKGFPVPFDLWDKEQAFTMKLHPSIFKNNTISHLNSWEKFMIYNLNTFVEVFDKYRGGGGNYYIIYNICSFIISTFSHNSHYTYRILLLHFLFLFCISALIYYRFSHILRALFLSTIVHYFLFSFFLSRVYFITRSVYEYKQQ